jgi:hypothetical protein
MPVFVELPVDDCKQKFVCLDNVSSIEIIRSAAGQTQRAIVQFIGGGADQFGEAGANALLETIRTHGGGPHVRVLAT